MKLNNKLQFLGNICKDSKYILDVGCDHALLDIYLASKYKINCLATDINEKPLNKAKISIDKLNLSKYITLKKHDGITIDDNIDTIVISGMGGILIKKIISKQINNINSKLVLCPNNDSEEIRRFMNKNNYKLEQEYLVKDKYIYEILVYNKGKEHLTRKQIMYGKYFIKDDLYKKYFSDKLNNLLEIEKKVPLKYIIKKIKITKKIRDLKSIL